MSISFSEFIQQNSANNLVQTGYPLNTIARSYLQDWYAGQAVAMLDGGMAYEPQLRKLNLDGSLASLALLDRFLDVVKPHLASNYRLLDHQTAQKNLLTFIAFYTGMVWCYHAKQSAYWTTFAHLTGQYPALTKAIDNDFSYSLAVRGEPISEAVDNRPLIMLGLSETVFFPLVTIIERLYPRRQNALQPQAPFFGYINDSLEKTVSQLLAIKKTPAEQEIPPEFLPLQNQAKPQFIQPLPKNSLSKNLNLSEDLLFSDKQAVMDFNQDFFETVREDYHHPFIEKQFEKLIETNLEPQENLVSQSLIADGQSAQMVEVPQTPTAQPPRKAEKSTTNSAKKPSKNIAFTTKQTAQNKRLEKQQREQEKQRLEQEEQKRIAEALANPQYHEGLLNQRKSMIDEKKSLKVVDTFTELEKSLKAVQAPIQASLQKAVTTEENDALLQAKQKANAILASEQRKAKRLAEEKLSGRLIKDISKVNQITEAGKPKELSSFDILLPETVADKTNPDSTGNAEIDEQYYQTCQVLANLQEQAEPDNSNNLESNNVFKQVLANLQQLAKQNHSGAMLQLALLRFRGEPAFNVAKDETQALKLVQASAKLGDHRAEKLLSKLYFSGQGVPLSTELGNYWLEQSASHGNADAKKLLAEMAIAQELRHTKQNDRVYVERLLMGVVALIVFALMIIFLIKT